MSRQCPACHAIIPEGADSCPTCTTAYKPLPERKPPPEDASSNRASAGRALALTQQLLSGAHTRFWIVRVSSWPFLLVGGAGLAVVLSPTLTKGPRYDYVVNHLGSWIIQLLFALLLFGTGVLLRVLAKSWAAKHTRDALQANADAVVPELRAALTAKDEQTRTLALQLLAGSVKADFACQFRSELVSSLHDNNESIRANAAQLLWRISWLPTSAIEATYFIGPLWYSHGFYKYILPHLRSNPDIYVPALAPMLDQFSCYGQVKQLIKDYGEKGVTPLLQFFSGASSNLRGEILNILGELGSKAREAVPYLEELIEKHKSAEAVRVEEVLARIKKGK